MGNNYVWTFSTGASIIPTVISTDPLNLATNVALDKTISADFSIAMDPATITSSTFTLMDGTTSLAGNVNYSGTTATFNPTNNLESDKVYTATISSDVTDEDGNALASNYVWTFSTGVSIIPTVISTDPLNLATNVALR
ncbi:MAG: Ig-like domain-containing protein [Bacteroidales bacterium]|nr:Ig-like domain-containing protein [Bacteroidales bacterium]